MIDIVNIKDLSTVIVDCPGYHGETLVWATEYKRCVMTSAGK